jgi:fructose-1,6-bisphosphatase/sedoheptulose 1,7-bisphosphatase-like protein
MHCKLIFNTEEEKMRAKKLGISDLNKKYCVNDLIKKDGYFIASGVTKGDILEGVSEESGLYEVSTLVLSTKHHEMQIINSTIIA